MNGRCVPIHPGGGWYCASSSAPSHYTQVSRDGEWRDPDFTRPAHCPVCGDDVYFIRHNGGSVWVDPPLGWPWTKHGCFVQSDETTRSFSLWTAKSSGLSYPRFGIIMCVTEDLHFSEPILQIQFTDSSRASLILRYTPSTSSLLGALVIISEEDSLLLHQQYAEIPFHSFTRLVERNANGFYSCPRCTAWVKEHTGHEAYCRNHCRKDGPVAMSTNKNRNKNIRAGGSKQEQGAKNRPLTRHSKPTSKQSSSTQASPVPQPHLRNRPQPLSIDERIRMAIDKVAKDAWSRVTLIEGTAEQFKQAKQEALRCIAMLSPSIKRQVVHRFTSEQWRPLLARRPST